MGATVPTLQNPLLSIHSTWQCLRHVEQRQPVVFLKYNQ